MPYHYIAPSPFTPSILMLPMLAGLLPFIGTALLRVKERPKNIPIESEIPTLLYKYSALYRNFLLRYISKAELLYHNM